jgi:hypothetical protein
MDKSHTRVQQAFRVHLIWMSGPESDPTVRVLLVGTGGRAAYDGVGSWSKCRSWFGQLSSIVISGDELAAIQKTLVRNQFVTIQEVHASLRDLESLGVRRADS